ncbi:hypothetical protein KK083_20115 [Fulvivirgaceae bacterium PWU4]|uniref:T9SS type B sorting domain-containing protein n=1 Tax=Chryseosolibacter histidini TaxID=2782349 RepID=A0AAP2DMT0_9BACT|nr:hypothetical protein [Chryseosolibacter histidini]MBT1699213.1 hypothetical protein [Chryseosolibacter histidini]
MKYISFIILLLSSLEAWTQSPWPGSWQVTATGSNHTVFIKATVNPSVDGELLVPGDVIGIFYQSGDTLACAGLTTWNGGNTFITAYGADGTNDGLKSNEVFKFRIWKHASDCVVEQVTASYVSGGVVTNTDRYADNGISELSALTGVNPLKIENFTVQVTNSTCIAGGKILLGTTGQGPVSVKRIIATDLLSGDQFPSSTHEITELPEAEYQLTIRTGGCALQWPDALLVARDYNCNFPVISPNKDGVAEDFYIPYPGTAKIYDRSGVLMTQLPTPSSWNATNDAGQLLPMGTYIIICEGQKEIMITVVR